MPVVAVAGTVTLIWLRPPATAVVDFTVAATVPNLTVGAAPMSLQMIDTESPTLPVVGVMETNAGMGVTGGVTGGVPIGGVVGKPGGFVGVVPIGTDPGFTGVVDPGVVLVVGAVVGAVLVPLGDEPDPPPPLQPEASIVKSINEVVTARRERREMVFNIGRIPRWTRQGVAGVRCEVQRTCGAVAASNRKSPICVRRTEPSSTETLRFNENRLSANRDEPDATPK